MARSLYPKEARIIQILLARIEETEKGRIRLAGFGKSTFYKAHRRATRLGWVTERYVPDPKALGIQRVTFQLGWPFSESWGEVVRAWEKQTGVVLLWTFRDLVFSVVWEGPDPPSSDHPSEGGRVAPAGQLLRNAWTVEVDARHGAIPVYFDFEGAWARWAGSGKTLAYPTPLGNLAVRGSQASAADIPARARHDALELMGGPARADGAADARTPAGILRTPAAVSTSPMPD
jgi:hypothetical protein